MALTHALSTNNYGVAKLIVSTSPANGTHTTLTSAMADASVGDTIFLRDSVTENVTITPGVNIAAWQGSSANTPSIIGTLMMTGAGTSTISGIRLQTNGASLLTVSGSVASIINITSCYLDCTNATGISFTSSSASARINIMTCQGNLGTTGIGLFSHSSAGTLSFLSSAFGNTGLSSTASTCSAGGINAIHSNFSLPITFSGTGICTFVHCSILTSTTNTTSLTLGGGSTSFQLCTIASGTASAISASSANNQFIDCFIASSNANAITGSGTISYTPFSFSSSSTVNTSTQTPLQVGPRIYTNGGISFDSGSNLLANFVDWTSWTPTLIGQTTAGTSTYTLQQGLYCRIGNVAIVQFNVTVSAATGTGNMNIGNLPFTINNTSGYIPMGSCIINSTGISFPASTTTIALYGLANTTAAAIQTCGSSAAAAFIQIANTAINVHGTLIYRI